MDDFNEVDWGAMVLAVEYHKNQVGYSNWSYILHRQIMLDNYGIDHSSTHVKIVDREKYMLFLLKFGN